MRSWNTPALLAAMGFCGLGSLFAQNPLLPMAPAPTPIDSPLSQPMLNAPQPETFAPASDYSGAAAPIPSDAAMQQPLSQYPLYSHAPVMESSSSMGCNSCAAAPVASCHTCAEPAPVSSCISCAVPQLMMAAPACGCQGGSGVASGLLSPNANSGGLHTRYPYYNYRHPWYYQGPPSQNVTIVW